MGLPTTLTQGNVTLLPLLLAPPPCPAPSLSSHGTLCIVGHTVTVVAPTENGQSGDYKEFDFDTTADDFFTHHPPAPATR